jgi:hypothetical protein
LQIYNIKLQFTIYHAAFAIFRSGRRYHADPFSPVLTIGKFNSAIGEREKRIILSPADVTAGKESCPSLPYEDVAARDKLSAEPFDTKALRVAIASVS